MGTIELECTQENSLRRLGQRNRADDDTAIAKRRYQSHVDETIPVIDNYLLERGPLCLKVSSADKSVCLS